MHAGHSTAPLSPDNHCASTHRRSASSDDRCAAGARPRRIQGKRVVRFNSALVLLGIAWLFRAYFSHSILELRVILNHAKLRHLSDCHS
jgi:hypothetical protein